jgi:hypothetical protein
LQANLILEWRHWVREKASGSGGNKGGNVVIVAAIRTVRTSEV